LALCTAAIAQEILTNDSIKKMAMARLGDDVIVSMIQNQAGHYDVTPETLIALKREGITVLLPMIAILSYNRKSFLSSPNVQALPGGLFLCLAPPPEIFHGKEASAPALSPRPVRLGRLHPQSRRLAEPVVSIARYHRGAPCRVPARPGFRWAQDTPDGSKGHYSAISAICDSGPSRSAH